MLSSLVKLLPDKPPKAVISLSVPEARALRFALADIIRGHRGFDAMTEVKRQTLRDLEKELQELDIWNMSLPDVLR